MTIATLKRLLKAGFYLRRTHTTAYERLYHYRVWELRRKYLDEFVFCIFEDDLIKEEN